MTEVAFAVVGGGPASHAAIEAYRNGGGTGAVVLISAEGRPPYRRPPLTKDLVRGESTPAELPLGGPDWLAEQAVRLVHARVERLNGRRLELAGGEVIDFEQCLLATGAAPRRLPVPGADRPDVHTVRTVDDVHRLLADLRDDDPVTVIGSGFIGCEIAASLRLRGNPVELVSDEPAPQAQRLGEQVSALLTGWLHEAGVATHFGVSVTVIEDGAVRTSDGRAAPQSRVVMAAGVTPRGGLGQAAGLAVERDALVVDAAMRTADPAVLAAGDAAYARNATARRHLHVEHWGDALAQGAVAGATVAGAQARWDDVPGFWSTIGHRTLKYAAWGDGFDDVRLRGDEDAFTVEYRRDGRLVGVLTHDRDGDYETGRAQIAQDAA